MAPHGQIGLILCVGMSLMSINKPSNPANHIISESELGADPNGSRAIVTCVERWLCRVTGIVGSVSVTTRLVPW